MLLSFNKCSISALTAPIHQSVEERLQEKIYRFVCLQYHVIVSSE